MDIIVLKLNNLTCCEIKSFLLVVAVPKREINLKLRFSTITSLYIVQS
jgi:hypothetical protein